MTKASSPPQKDAPPAVFRQMAEDWLYDEAEHDEELKALLTEQGCFGNYPLNEHIPEEWVDNLARELDAAVSDRLGEWLETLKQGRPPPTFLVEWEARDLIPREDAPEAAAGDGHRW